MDKLRTTPETLNELISTIIINIGIPPHIKGYLYLRTAVNLVIMQPEVIHSITKKLYPKVAEHFTASSNKVERLIRHAIEVSWSKGKIKNINVIFGFRIYKEYAKPSNGDLIALLADRLYFEIVR